MSSEVLSFFKFIFFFFRLFTLSANKKNKKRSRLTATDAIARKVEALLAATPEIENYATNIGRGNPQVVLYAFRQMPDLPATIAEAFAIPMLITVTYATACLAGSWCIRRATAVCPPAHKNVPVEVQVLSLVAQVLLVVLDNELFTRALQSLRSSRLLRIAVARCHGLRCRPGHIRPGHISRKTSCRRQFRRKNTCRLCAGMNPGHHNRLSTCPRFRVTTRALQTLRGNHLLCIAIAYRRQAATTTKGRTLACGVAAVIASCHDSGKCSLPEKPK